MNFKKSRVKYSNKIIIKLKKTLENLFPMRYEYMTINKHIDNKAIGLLAKSLALVEKTITQKTKNLKKNDPF